MGARQKSTAVEGNLGDSGKLEVQLKRRNFGRENFHNSEGVR